MNDDTENEMDPTAPKHPTSGYKGIFNVAMGNIKFADISNGITANTRLKNFRQYSVTDSGICRCFSGLPFCCPFKDLIAALHHFPRVNHEAGLDKSIIKNLLDDVFGKLIIGAA